MKQQKSEFLKTLSDYKNLVWPNLQNYLSQLVDLPPHCQIDSKYSSLVDFHFKMAADYPNRQGKYLRPTLVLLTAQAMGINPKLAVNTATAMQLSEDWILNHDDIEDDSKSRRGLPALHQIYGKELAINAGDALHNLVWKILLDNIDILGPEKSKAICEEFFTMINRTIIGQTAEIKWTQQNKTNLTIQDILFILESKTGYYTIAGPMRLGAILAGATPKQLDQIYKFGITLGYVFQIKDDLLDLTTNFSGLKHQIGNDIYEGKRTVMLLHLLRHASDKDKQKLNTILAKSRDQKTPAEVSWMISAMSQYGSLKYAQDLINKYQNEASSIFETDLKFLSQNTARLHLQSFIDFIVNRDH